MNKPNTELSHAEELANQIADTLTSEYYGIPYLKVIELTSQAIQTHAAELQRENERLSLDLEQSYRDRVYSNPEVEFMVQTQRKTIESIRVENTQLKTQLSAAQDQIVVLREAVEDIDEQCETNFVKCENCGSQEDLKGCFIQDTAKEALTSTTQQAEEINKARRESTIRECIEKLKTEKEATLSRLEKPLFSERVLGEVDESKRKYMNGIHNGFHDALQALQSLIEGTK